MPKKTVPGIEQYWHKTGICGIFTRTALRTLQFVLAVTVAGLYGVDLAHATKTNTHARSEWIYAEFVAALSVITCVVHCFVTVIHVAWSTWDGVLFILWLAQLGVFGTTYISNPPAGQDEFTTSVIRMEAAVWINLVNMVLWLTTFVLGIAWCIRTRKVTRRIEPLDEDKGCAVRSVADQDVGSYTGVEFDAKGDMKEIEKQSTRPSDHDTLETDSMMKKEKS
ncbi:hypothetical protein N7492_006477 [Penicillium capsulatum]|uniref:MARVEL domain-containing protein n=1 Tax=Penicillium capsulatum TaxID=69766 RepID=A0A9W9I1D0_9EURO|nr:hypothetical protein N7492_006477 [Penicillium capsulatum]KAJ6116318.1 hypothetical protein N7512_006043 [Penicillium capsulatum]